MHIVVGHAIVDGGARAAATVVYVARGRTAELLESVKARNVGAATVQVVRLGGGKVNRLTVIRGVVVGHRRGVLEHGEDGSVYHTRQACAQGGGYKGMKPEVMVD